MSRKEFSKAVKVAVVKRATKNGVTYCEECNAMAKNWDIDHINPDGLTGKPGIENAKLLCKPCHSEKTKLDVAVIAQAKRREAKNLGVKATATIKAAGFAKLEKPVKNRSPLGPPRPMFQ